MTSSPERALPVVLLIDEIEALVRLLELELGFEGLKMERVLLTEDVVGRAEALKPDAIVLGSILPTPHIFETLELLKRYVNAPVLFVCASGNEADNALALRLGAADVIDRPFLPEDLILRLRSLLNEDTRASNEVQRGVLRIDKLHRVVWKDDKKLEVSTNEWALLLSMAESPETTSAAALLVNVWGAEYQGELRLLDLWIQRLRSSIGDDPNDPKIILGDKATGFRLAT